MKKNISILGSTGSIGLDTFKILSRKKDSFKVNILAANKNYNLICDQIIKFKPKIFIIDNQETYLKVISIMNSCALKLPFSLKRIS